MLNFQSVYQFESSSPARAPKRHGAWGGWRQWLALPFELARHAHAAAVRGGALPRSMLESQRFERQVALLEQLALGPMARSV